MTACERIGLACAETKQLVEQHPCQQRIAGNFAENRADAAAFDCVFQCGKIGSGGVRDIKRAFAEFLQDLQRVEVREAQLYDFRAAAGFDDFMGGEDGRHSGIEKIDVLFC